LLAKYGQESSGALTLLAQGVGYPNDDEYVELTQHDLRLALSNPANSSLLTVNPGLNMSLAGVQNKLGIRYTEEKFWLPMQVSASSHIIKPDNNNPDFPFCPANEFFCMRLSEKMGLPVPSVNLLHLPEPLSVVTRYDREISETGHIKRLHQIDLCQLVNKWVGYKYESHGGIGLSEIFNSLQFMRQTAIVKDRVLRWIIFNYLIGNSAAHAKNLSFIVRHAGINLAPFYDLLCVQAYLPESLMAMSIQGENKPGWIELSHWKVLASQAGVASTLLLSYLQRQTAMIEMQAQNLLSLPEFTHTERKFLSDKVIPVIRQQVEFISSQLLKLRN